MSTTIGHKWVTPASRRSTASPASSTPFTAATSTCARCPSHAPVGPAGGWKPHLHGRSLEKNGLSLETPDQMAFPHQIRCPSWRMGNEWSKSELPRGDVIWSPGNTRHPNHLARTEEEKVQKALIPPQNRNHQLYPVATPSPLSMGTPSIADRIWAGGRELGPQHGISHANTAVGSKDLL